MTLISVTKINLSTQDQSMYVGFQSMYVGYLVNVAQIA